MMASLSLLALVIMIEAVPVSTYLRAFQRSESPGVTPELVVAAAAVVVILIGATILPLRLAVRRIEQMEF
jgi:hypothetical protein